MFKKTMLFSMAAAFLFVGIISVNNANAIPTRKNWQNLKKKYNIKKGLSKVNMGKAFKKFQEAYDKYNKTDPKKIVKALNTLEKKLDTYMKSAKKKKVDDKFYEKLEKIKKDINGMRKIFESRANPLKAVKKSLDNAIKGFKQLKASSPKSDFQQYYKEEFRLVGMALKDLVAKEPDFKTTKDNWFSDAGKVNKAIQTLKDTEKAKKDLLKDIDAALRRLNAVMKKI